MKPSYEELEEQLNRSRRLCDAALANERVWETAMMQACGEDGPKSVADKFAELKAQLAALAAENAGLKSAIDATIGWQQSTDPENVESVRMLVDIKTPSTDAFLAEVRASGVGSLSNAVQSVISERKRQQSAEGWTPEHDDKYDESQLLWASSCYVLNTIQPFNRMPMDWPWASEWWKPTNPRRDLVKAGALILAEIERIDRQEAAQ